MTAACYLALAGEAHVLGERLSTLVPPRGTQWRLNLIFESSNLVIFASPETPHCPLQEQRGMVIGRLFRGGGGRCDPVDTLSLSESRHAGWSRGQSLLETLWGGYAAFLRDDDGIAVLRDPSGGMPVHHCEDGRIQLYFSDFGLLEDLDLGPPTLDDEFLRQWLTYPFLRTARTGVAGQCELLPGMCRRSGEAGAAVEMAWTPWRAAADESRIEEFDEAARRLREVAMATVPRQLAGVDAPVLELSGGLDSSIVAACLTQGGIDFRAVNFVTAAPDGDERNYARLVAEHLGIELAELREDELPLDLSPPPARTLRPPLNPVLQPLNRALSTHARQAGTADFVTGAGGDNLFGYITTAAPILDAARDGGWRGAWETLQDVATLGDCTIWKAAHYALRKHLRRSSRPLWKRDERFLAPAGLAAEPDPHPWLDAPEGSHAGKIEHVQSLVLVHHFVDARYHSGEALHHPLLNQPLIELCLAVPTWLWLRGGLNRAVARAAFADLLPVDIIQRRTKGRLESMCSRAFATNRERIADLLLFGYLAQRGLIDRAEVEAYLHAAGPPPDDAYFRMFDLVSLELWLRSWRS
ncbi:MAG TPA: asparagine synthase-related protein [Allosphingosinicella sp.]|jgi:asparagine synthase (glutamine-hydrolysing)|uniref:asparagine synthase-related protein n=1 Tax=Allosphingosinicella sp. TaxID=2823234 RepID=UPI002F288825